jgi:CRISPR/Cas system-associated protein Cas7 (RAMP superfamily)
MNMNATPPTIDLSKRIDQFVRLRDEIKKLDEDHKTKMKPYREALDQLNSILLGHLNTIDGQSVKTQHGTVYRTSRKSASLADPEKFMNYVISNDMFHLIDRKANVTAVEDFISENGEVPPGVNFKTVFTVGVLRR